MRQILCMITTLALISIVAAQADTVHIPANKPVLDSDILEACKQIDGTGSYAVPESWVDDDFDSSTPGWQVTHFDTVQDGIDAVEWGGVVNVYEGIYTEFVYVLKPLHLLGDDPSTTIIDAQEQASAIWADLDGSGVTISGFTLKNSANEWPHAGIVSNNVSGNTYTDNIIVNCYIGIHISDSSDNLISENQVFENEWMGIGFFGSNSESNDNLITNNSIRNNGKYNIHIYNSIKNRFELNSFTISEGYGNPYAYAYYFDSNEDLNNTIDSSDTINGMPGPLLYSEIETTQMIENLQFHYEPYPYVTNYGTIILYKCKNVTIANCTILNNNVSTGISLYECSDCLLIGNQVSSSGTGIHINGIGSGHYIENNNINNNISGIKNYYNDNLTICGNVISHNKYVGLELNLSDNHIVSHNDLKYNGKLGGSATWCNMVVSNSTNVQIINNASQYSLSNGLHISKSTNAIIKDNLINSNKSSGIRFFNDVDGCLIANNRIADNESAGLNLDDADNNTIHMNELNGNKYGIHLGSFSPGCYYNHIYFNNFYDNYNGSLYVSSNCKDNYWDNGYPAGGNYWEDYLGTDGNGDGIGDFPHLIQNSNEPDNFPLMHKFNGLSVDEHFISVSGGGTINFDLNLDDSFAYRKYLILGGMTGTTPGFPLPGGLATLPVNWDLFTDIVWQFVNTPFFIDFLGQLDASGNGAAMMHFDFINPILIGEIMYFASTCNCPFDVASNPVRIKIVE